MRYTKLSGCLILFLLLGLGESKATHLRAGEITVERVSCNGLTFRITITAYTNTGSVVRFSNSNSGILSFGDGSSINPPQTENTVSPELGAGIGYVKFETTHTFPGAGRYIITYKEQYRNAAILNMSRPVNTQFYLETLIIIDPFIGCDNSPRLSVPPIDKGCTGKAWFHTPGAYDLDAGDSLSYEFVLPKQDKDVPVNNYRDPNAKEFYDRIGLNYGTANEAQKDPPTFTINPLTGIIIWDAPGAPGEYNIAFKVIEWRKIGGVFKQIGYVTRDMQIIIEDCKNQRPELTVPQDVCVVAGTSISETIVGSDLDPTDKLKLDVFSEVLSLNPSPATFKPSPPVFQDQPASLQFNWNTQCNHVRDQPYQVNFKVTDQPTPGQGPSLVQFKTWRIKVIGPKPIWKTATPDNLTRAVKLEWENYACATNAVSMEVWRRVDSNNSTVGSCITGMPASFGYSKIQTVSIGSTTYADPGLAPGAKYCYRLVAVFPAQAKSIVSDEICVPPFKADRAIITKVSIEKTSSTQGQIKVEWMPPFDLVAQDPDGFTYKVFRAEGFTGRNKLVAAFPNTIDKTFILDDDLNTQDVIYNYRVLTFDNDGATQLDTSAAASSVRLEIIPTFKELQLRWAANVPWSNNTFTFPTHAIYRGTAGAAESQFVKIADVNVNQKGFVFTDIGLNITDSYCYRVETFGSYGNPLIPVPLRNFSQISCAQANPSGKPCAPILAGTVVNCDEYRATANCGDGTYSNTLHWRKPTDPACRLDIKSYHIYFAARVGDAFKKLELKEPVTDTVFVYKNPSSFAGCYKVSAVDRAGNEGELSETFCFDNCPYYELPNVFTPNGDKCNDVFSAYSTRHLTIGETVISECNGIITSDQFRELQNKCARFVDKVNFTVYNRWGGVVYDNSLAVEKNNYIDWNGKDNNNRELSAGTYYYEAQVTFIVVDPAKANRTIKGWVQLLR
jgi:hypothetical protein